ncbi:hypothetical protein QOZ80_6BG0487850 [Eleusine coracana subsp. coracana]|nr:hypothetical protein QOZ80_6BG0487850 [Eleusine coracana subsp. coracana]
MDCPNPKRSAVPGLPDDPLIEILTRVPAKSICRFKCVSKGWLGFINDPLYRKSLPQTLSGFFLSDTFTGKIYRHFINPTGKSVSPEAPSFSFLTNLHGVANTTFLHSCNGIFLFGHGPDRFHPLGYLVCNPATQQWVAVPSSGWTPSQLKEEEEDYDSDDNEDEETSHTYLLFDPAVSPHFRLVMFALKGGFSSEAAVHTYSSETGVWIDRSGGEQSKQREGDEHQRLDTFGAISTLDGSAFVSGLLHLVVSPIQKDREVIVAVDGEGKTRKVLHYPEKPDQICTDVIFIGQSQGRLHCITTDRSPENTVSFEIMIWVLEDYANERWVLKHSVNSSRLFGNKNCFITFSHNVVVAIHPDCNLLYYFLHGGRILVSYDMDSDKLTPICIVGRANVHATPYVPYFAESSALRS